MMLYRFTKPPEQRMWERSLFGDADLKVFLAEALMILGCLLAGSGDFAYLFGLLWSLHYEDF